ncbi:AraC family transcriptional regulator [Pedobacter foliorum]|uniref:AraC family transcriptional regulator n=1 Tax=Pedobacter foliorum TaxID=2739058 RepID=UPI00156772FE|nr:AraC family transcriptional regulator [Pedobacter foliorum]NRF41163.1 helix-turn-helix transcriptional regulator [Pedobacter foliorum]
MKSIVQKSAIPYSKVLVVKRLEELNFDPNLHLHPEYQLFLVLKGWGTRFIGDNIKPFNPGDLVFTGPNLPHLWRNDPADIKKLSKTLGIVIYFPQNFLGDIINTKEELENIRLLFENAGRGLEIHGKTNKVVSKMMQELLHAKGATRIIILLQILNTLAESTECHPITHVNYIPINNRTESDRMNKIYHYIMKNFKHKISLEVIADLINMTPTSFSRYFKSRVNKSFSDFLKELRIDYARKLLNENKISINSVSYDAGYTTLSNFNKQFKEVTGKTPLQYRNEYLKIRTESI